MFLLSTWTPQIAIVREHVRRTIEKFKEDIKEVMKGEDFDINVLMEEPPGRLLINLSDMIAPTLSTSSCQAPRPISFEYNSADSHANYSSRETGTDL